MQYAMLDMAAACGMTVYGLARLDDPAPWLLDKLRVCKLVGRSRLPRPKKIITM